MAEMDYSERSYYRLTSDNEELADLALISFYNYAKDFSNVSNAVLDTNRLWDITGLEAKGVPHASGYVRLRGVLLQLAGIGILELVQKGNKKQAHRFRMVKTQWHRQKPLSMLPTSQPTATNTHIPYTNTTPRTVTAGEETVPAATYQDALNKNAELMKRIPELEEAIRTVMAGVVEKDAENAKLKESLNDASRRSRIIKVERYDGSKLTIKDAVLPKYFDDLLALMTCRMNVMLVGPAGAGKTYAAEKAAEVLGLKFAAISCSAGMSEAQLTGRVRPKLAGDDLFQSTGFLDCYETGGVFLFDELDAADSNLMLTVNTALANNYCNVPNRDGNTRAVRHQDFVCLATANTFGRGATRMYAGRNQLDEATVDRFRIGLIEVDYDKLVEEALCPDDELRSWCWKVREGIEKAQLRRIMSTRFMRDAYAMKTNAGWDLNKIQKVFFNGWGQDEQNKAVYQMTQTNSRGY